MDTHITTAHVDGDVLVYRSGFAAQHTHYLVFKKGEDEQLASFPSSKELNEWLEMWGEDDDLLIETEVVAEPVQNALYSVKNTLRRIRSVTKATKLKVWLTDGPSNFRINLAKTAVYKGNRVAAKPIHYEALREYLKEVWSAEVVYGEEADDAMAIEQWKAVQMGEEEATCICTIDKDLDMVPGYHYNFVTDNMYYVTEQEGQLWFYTQLLMGDPTDNIIGIQGVGPKKAEKLLAGCANEQEYYAVALEQYQKAFGEDAKDRLIENARLLWMRSDFNEFWEPPHERAHINS
jgi:5'-3' exonuclease